MLIMRRIVLLAVAFAVLMILMAGIPGLFNFLADWYWFSALEYDTVFVTRLTTKVVLWLLVTIVSFGVLFANVRVALRGVVPDPLIIPMRGQRPSLDVNRFLRLLTWPAAGLFALMVGSAATGMWLTVLRYLKQSPFGTTDPVFGKDIAYFVFTLPMVNAVLGILTTLIVVSLVLVTPLYLLRRDVVVLQRRVTVEPSAQWHLGVLLAGLFVALALRVWIIDVPSISYATTGPFVGASYSDLGIKLPALRILAFVAVVGAVVVLWGARRRQLVRYVAIATVLYLGVALLGQAAVSATQRFVVVPNELVKETPQLERHITATRAAWGLADVQVRDLSGEARLTLADIESNATTIRNVRLWDRDPLLQTFGQLQEIRTYYDFVSVDDDRYWIDGEYRQVLLSPRELNSASLPTRSFINERLTFTHGMGLTLGPVNQVTQEGLPVLFIRDLPPVSDVSLEVTRPGIYYGELSNDWVFVNTNAREFDYPAGDGNVFTDYEGIGGVAVSSLLRRLVFSAHFRSMKILLSQDITNESRVMFHRRIQERVHKALPFLYWDGDPYVVVAEDGTLKWIVDGFTVTDRYPYAHRLSDGTNYMRNSVKVVVDAYDGTVRAYIADPDDPLIRTYERVFPGIFAPLDSLDAGLRAHLRYPEDLFRIQTTLYATYHMDEAEIFYHREDEWQIPLTTRGENARDPFLRHIIMKLPGEEREEYILMTPFTPRGKDNLSAWIVARNDGPHLGDLVVYRFPRQRLVFGPTQVVNRINQDTEISRQISLWDQRGSQVIRGNLLVIPIEEALIFVQALYLRAEGGRIPELKRVIVAYENQVVMEETLEEGLALLFGGAVRTPQPLEGALREAAATAAERSDASLAELVESASAAYERALQAQRAGDWARYGDEVRRVGELLRALQQEIRTDGQTP
jgi:uncharacterized membrane protein (UPF0182 family)